jgi:iron only hydrogenase large subunit-like protein
LNAFIHSIQIITDKCKGKRHCIRVCPTQALRVRNGKAALDPTLCIDCGECIVVCPEKAIKSTADSLADINKFKFKVAIPSPTLFGQFNVDVTPKDIVEGLLSMGFDAVYDFSVETEQINLAIRDYLDDFNGTYPLISSACPVVVRLIQVAYPEMVDQIIPIEPPREIAARSMKEYYSEKLGIPQNDIGAIYLTPCPAKMIAIRQPAEDVKSHLDLAIGISEIYNPLLKAITKNKTNREKKEPSPDLQQSGTSLGWVLMGGQSVSLKPSRYLTVSQMQNIIRIFDDIEKGKIRGIEFLECYACVGGCVGGPLTGEDMFVSRSKIQKLIASMADVSAKIAEEAKKRYKKGDYFIRQKIKPRMVTKKTIDFEKQINQMKMKDELLKKLPGINCGLCGAPTCIAFAEDVASGSAVPDDCIILSGGLSEKLKKQLCIDTPNDNKKDKGE